ncbi:unnamed protein product [Timema podura]|uniref:Uncharacterized protein n=1 Tax=Timema podura TaxID=61482 RepID=A0ABN7P0V7_TIMPD|nr:unnamed protein product [Timema podura]
MMKLVVTSLLLLTLMVQTGSGLKCYVCEELLDSSCGATYNGTTLTDCGSLLPNRACVTITESSK